MNVLVDHCAWHNLGDVAMVESVVRRHLRAGNVTCHVVDRPAFETALWDWPRTARAIEPIASRWASDRLPAGMPLLWRTELLDLLATGRGGLDARRRLVSQKGFRYREYCGPYDALHVVGGGFLNDVLVRLLYDKCTLINAFTDQGKPVLLTGQELGPFRFGIARNALYRALRRCKFVGLREPVGSLDLCQQSGLGQDRYEVLGDDSFGLEPAPLPEVRAVLARHGLEPGKFLAANVRLSSYADPDRHLAWVAGLLGGLVRELDQPVLLLPLSFTQRDDDVGAGERLAGLVGNGRVCSLSRKGLTAALVKGLLGQASLAAGTSYHFCTFALSGGVPAVCLFDGRYYAHKAAGLVSLWEDARFALRLGSRPPADAARDLAAMTRDGNLRASLAARARTLKAQWEARFDSACRTAFGQAYLPVSKAGAFA